MAICILNITLRHDLSYISVLTVPFSLHVNAFAMLVNMNMSRSSRERLPFEYDLSSLSDCLRHSARCAKTHAS